MGKFEKLEIGEVEDALTEYDNLGENEIIRRVSSEQYDTKEFSKSVDFLDSTYTGS